MAMKRIQISLDKRVLEMLEKQKEKSGASIAEIMRRSVYYYLKFLNEGEKKEDEDI